MTRLNLTDVSRCVSHALRHEPWLYELELDDEGWTSIDDLLGGLADERPAWASLTPADLLEMNLAATKRRYEIVGKRIRALYGHSLPGKLKKEPAVPPDTLYHGTSRRALERIRGSGLQPMRRQYVHLSIDEATAREVGKRKDKTPVILHVRAGQAHAFGLPFYVGNEKVWLAERVPRDFVDFAMTSS